MNNKKSNRQSTDFNVLFESNKAKNSIFAKSIKGSAATAATQVIRTALQLVSTAALGRILAPEDFGLVAMVMAITNLASMLGELGLSAATVQKESISHIQVSGLFWVNTLFGFIISAVVALSAPLMALFYEEPRVIGVALALSVTFFLTGMSVQHKAILSRNLRFGAISLVEIASVGISVAVSIILALIGAGYWAIAAMHVTMAIVRTIGFWIATPWVPSFPSRNSQIRELLGFGAHVTSHTIVNYFARNADNLLIGRFIGTAGLGFYSRAYNLMMLPIRQIRTPLISVGLPVLSRLQNEPEQYRRYYLTLAQVVSFFAVPLSLFLGAFSFDVIHVLLGPGWQETADVFRILSVAAAIQPVLGTTGMVMLSSGNAQRYMRIGLLMGVFIVVSFIVGLPWGIKGVAVGYTILNVLSFFPQLYFAFRDTPIQLAAFTRDQAYPVISSLIALTVTVGVSRVFDVLPPFIELLVFALFMLIVYLGIFASTKQGRAVLMTVKKSFHVLISKRN